MKLSNMRINRVTMTLLALGCSVLCISGSDPLATSSALADGLRSSAAVGPRFTLEFGSVSAGGGPLDNGGFAIISKMAVGTMTSADFTIEVGAVNLLVPTAGPCNSACVWDIDNTGDVRVPDLIKLLSCWGPFGPDPVCACLDIDSSGDIRVPDLIAMLAKWGPCL